MEEGGEEGVEDKRGGEETEVVEGEREERRHSYLSSSNESDRDRSRN